MKLFFSFVLFAITAILAFFVFGKKTGIIATGANNVPITTDKTGTDTKAGTTPASTKPVDTSGPKEQILARYNGGQFLYAKFNGKTNPVGTLGYLANGTLIYTSAVYFSFEVSEYVDVVPENPESSFNTAGVNITKKLGKLFVSGIYANVFYEHKTLKLSNYQNAVGFLENGQIVYQNIENEGTENENIVYSV